MEIKPEGRHFRLVHENELPEIMVVLERYMPEALKVTFKNKKITQSIIIINKLASTRDKQKTLHMFECFFFRTCLSSLPNPIISYLCLRVYLKFNVMNLIFMSILARVIRLYIIL